MRILILSTLTCSCLLANDAVYDSSQLVEMTVEKKVDNNISLHDKEKMQKAIRASARENNTQNRVIVGFIKDLDLIQYELKATKQLIEKQSIIIERLEKESINQHKYIDLLEEKYMGIQRSSSASSEAIEEYEDLNTSYSGSYVVVVNSANVRSRPSVMSEVVNSFKRGDVFKVDGKTGKWYKINSSGYIYSKIVTQINYIGDK